MRVPEYRTRSRHGRFRAEGACPPHRHAKRGPSRARSLRAWRRTMAPLSRTAFTSAADPRTVDRGLRLLRRKSRAATAGIGFEPRTRRCSIDCQARRHSRCPPARNTQAAGQRLGGDRVCRWILAGQFACAGRQRLALRSDPRLHQFKPDADLSQSGSKACDGRYEKRLQHDDHRGRVSEPRRYRFDDQRLHHRSAFVWIADYEELVRR